MSAPADAPRLRESLRSLPGSTFVLFGGMFVNRLGFFVLPFFTLYLTRKGYTAPEAGGAIAAYGLGELGAWITGGLLADRLGRRNTIVLSMFSAGALMLVLWRAQSLGLIYLLMFGVAWAAELAYPAAGALIADVVSGRSRVAAFTLFRLSINTGQAAGLALGGFLAERSFDLLFVGDAASSIAFGVISLIALPHGVRSTRQDEVDFPTARRSILADRGFLLFLLGMLLIRLVYAQSVSSLPLHVRDQGFGPSTYGVLLAWNCALVVLVELPVIAWVQRPELLRIVSLGQVLIGLGFAALLFADTVPLLAISVAIWTLGEICTLSAAQAIAADRAPAHARGRYQSALGVTRAVGFVAGPMLGTVLYSASPALLWWGCGGLGALAASLAMSARRLPVAATATPIAGR